ncbi:MAG: TnpV protein [Clostridia bacterium]|nr:TnpV protein [Clostridia bacterium]
MKKFIIDDRSGWEYELKGEQYYPTGRVMKNGVMTPDEIPDDNEPKEEKPIGVWGCGSPVEISAVGRSTDRGGSRDRRHLRYIRQYKKSLYFELFVSGKLNAYLADINAQAEDSFPLLVKEMAAREGVTEKHKVEDQMAWVQRMNNIRERATEIVNRELIFT